MRVMTAANHIRSCERGQRRGRLSTLRVILNQIELLNGWIKYRLTRSTEDLQVDSSWKPFWIRWERAVAIKLHPEAGGNIQSGLLGVLFKP